MITDGVFPMVIGGMQSHSANLALHLARAGAIVDVIHPTPGPATEAEAFFADEADAVRLRYVPWPRGRRYPGHYPAELREYSRHAKRLADDLRPDWIYVQGLCGDAFLAGREGGAPPVAVNLHGLEMFQRAPGVRTAIEQRLLRPLARRAVRHADLCFSLGGRLTPLLVSIGADPSRIAETPVGIDDDWVTSDARPPLPLRRFVFVGRNERRKGLRELDEAATRLLATHHFELELVGPIPPERQNTSPAFTYHGAVHDRKKLRAIISAADVLVCPSHAEGMPTVILEGMAAGLAIIATRVGAVENLVGTDNGWLIEPGDSHRLYWAMRAAIETDDADLLGMKRASVARISNRFTWTSIAEKTLRAMEENSTKGPRPS